MDSEAFVLLVVCSWCDATICARPCEPALHGKTSHSICPMCEAAVIATIDRVPPEAFALVPVE